VAHAHHHDGRSPTIGAGIVITPANGHLDDFGAFLTVVEFGLGEQTDVDVTAMTPLADAGLDSLGLMLVSVMLSEHGAQLADDDWADLETIGDLWDLYQFRLTNPASW